jgi:hypothetical protein
MNKIVKFYRSWFPAYRIVFPAMLYFLAFSGFLANAQAPIPEVTVRFANPYFDCPTQNYCVDVEFISNTEGLQVFGMNVRFFYDDNILEFLSMGDFAEGYGVPNPPVIATGPPDSGAPFGLAGPSEWFNGEVFLLDFSSVYLSTTEWTKLFNICFHVDDPNSLSLYEFCPTLIWDLQEDPPEFGGGFLPGDDGVVITIVDPTYTQESAPTIEQVVQFNWQYFASETGFGIPVAAVCVSTICGYIIPVSNWALFLAIGLMFVATIFIYRRRISG